MTIGYLLDTNVVSEMRTGRSGPNVLVFFDSVDERSLYVSVLTLGELRKGVAMRRKKDPDAANTLANWVDITERNLGPRILGIDAATARLWGELSAQRTRSVIDTLIAATAITHNLTLVTRNTRDVQDTGVRVLNPWQPRRA